jgi:hypothetical protein
LIQQGFTKLSHASLPKQDVVIQGAKIDIPRLQHGLDRVIMEPGLHRMQPTSGKFNFSPFLSRIYQPHELDLKAIPPFVTTSRDKVRFLVHRFYRTPTSLSLCQRFKWGFVIFCDEGCVWYSLLTNI